MALVSFLHISVMRVKRTWSSGGTFGVCTTNFVFFVSCVTVEQQQQRDPKNFEDDAAAKADDNEN